MSTCFAFDSELELNPTSYQKKEIKKKNNNSSFFISLNFKVRALSLLCN